MRRRLRALLVGTVALGGLGLLVAAMLDGRTLTGSVPVPSSDAPAVIAPGGSVCEKMLRLPLAVNGAQLPLVTGGHPGPSLRVVLRAPGGRALAIGRVAGGYRATGYPDLPVTTARFPGVPASRRVRLCVSNRGVRAVALYGGKSQRSRGSHGIALVALRESPEPLLLLLPRVFERAALFRPSWVGPWTFWLLLAAVLLAVPGLLVVAVERAACTGGDAP
jgi:hypothetical protein